MDAAARGTGMVLTENRTFRLACFFLFYFAQGLPVGLTSVALPAWLASNGASDAAVGALVATAYLAWSYKFVIAAVMDRYTYLPMGRRRILGRGRIFCASTSAIQLARFARPLLMRAGIHFRPSSPPMIRPWCSPPALGQR